MKKIAGYYRLSMEDEDGKAESNSITNQRLIVKKYVAQDKELSRYPFCEFYDDGYSGTTMCRPGLQEMLELAGNHEIQAVIVKDISRFSRDYIDLGTYMEQIFPLMGVRFIVIADHYDSKDYSGYTADMDIAFKGLLADFYCKDISVKVISSLEAKRRQGKYSTGLVPFGYQKDEDNPYKLIVVPKEAEVVRYIFELSASGSNLVQICKKLNDEGVMTPLEFKNLRKKQNRKELQRQHKFWQAGTVRNILTNESYVGNMVYGKTKQTAAASGKKNVRPREEWKVFENHHEPIVEREIFDKVQEKYGQKRGGNRKSIEYPLKGKLFCKYCKRSLKVMKLGGGKLFFYCQNKRLASNTECLSGSVGNEKIEDIVLDKIKEWAALWADSNTMPYAPWPVQEEKRKECEEDIARLEKKMQVLKAQKATFLEEYHAGTLSKEQYKDCRNQIAGMMAEIESECENKKKEAAQRTKEEGKPVKGDREASGGLGMEGLTKEIADVFIRRIEMDREGNPDICWASFTEK